ncbi:uncharacterized protein [Clytia hemisphaerica]|uniref:Uncharacterized protein n=1 Tax=Clytia hemisphaerica TaxID=252671 RepID=A0A7M5XCQ3_9CNID|eukprot:TCONS_00033675-protein
MKLAIALVIVLVASINAQQQVNNCVNFPTCIAQKFQSGISGMDLIKAQETCSTDWLVCTGVSATKVEGCWVSCNIRACYKLDVVAAKTCFNNGFPSFRKCIESPN